MKKIFALIMSLLLIVSAAAAMANGNATILLQGEDGFNDYIAGMVVWQDKLLMSSWSKLYCWSPETRKVAEIEGFHTMQENINVGERDEDGALRIQLGDEELILGEEQNFSLGSSLHAVGDTLYIPAYISGEDGFEESGFVQLVIDEDGSCKLGRFVNLGDALIEDYGDGYYGVRDLMGARAVGNRLFGISYGMNGQELTCIDLEAGEAESFELEVDASVQCFAPRSENSLLVVTSEYMNDETIARLSELTFEDGEVALTEIGSLPVKHYDAPSALVYDAARSQLYYVLGGSLWRQPLDENGLGEAVEFSDMPLDAYTDTSAVLLGDSYVICSYQGVIARDVTTEKIADARLRINDIRYSDALKKAYFTFTDAHPEYAVSISNSGSDATLMSDMLSRSAESDIYCLSVSDEAFSALLERGYMAELDSSEKLTAAVGKMYPFLVDTVSHDGKLFAIPVSASASCLAFNKKLFTEKLGYAESDIPTSWPALLALLTELSDGRLEETPEVTVFAPGYTQQDARDSLFSAMLIDYFLWLDNDAANYEKDGEPLLKLCAAFETIDWAGFGLPEEYSEDSWTYDPSTILMDTTSLYVGYSSYESTPLLLSIEEGGEPLAGAEVSAVFVNPFSEHREQAIEYLEYMLDAISRYDHIALDPTDNEPVVSIYYEENLKYYDDYIVKLKESIEKADDPDHLAELEMSLQNILEYREDYEREGMWEISPKAIENYRHYATYLRTAKTSLWANDIADPLQQYLDGAIGAEQLVRDMEKTMEMKRLEGM